MNVFTSELIDQADKLDRLLFAWEYDQDNYFMTDIIYEWHKFMDFIEILRDEKATFGS